MLTIAGSLLAGWILKLFGFNILVTAGMAQVFGVTINTLGYYFLFAMLGAFRSVGFSFSQGFFFNKARYDKTKAKIDLDLNKVFNKK